MGMRPADPTSAVRQARGPSYLSYDYPSNQGSASGTNNTSKGKREALGVSRRRKERQGRPSSPVVTIGQ